MTSKLILVNCTRIPAKKLLSSYDSKYHIQYASPVAASEIYEQTTPPLHITSQIVTRYGYKVFHERFVDISRPKTGQFCLITY